VSSASPEWRSVLTERLQVANRDSFAQHSYCIPDLEILALIVICFALSLHKFALLLNQVCLTEITLTSHSNYQDAC